MDVASLWIGKKLSIPHLIALSSYKYYGHTMHLYVYDMSMYVPDGVIKIDANSIIPEDKIFTHYGKYAAFSDLFRYKMILDTGYMWVDADMICLSDLFYSQEDYVFVEEAPSVYCGGILKMPKESDLALWLYDESNKKAIPMSKEIKDAQDFSWESWVYLGPELLTEGINKFLLNDYAISNSEGHVVDIYNENPGDLFWNPDCLDEMIKRLSNARSITFFNSWLDQRNFNKNIITSGSLIELLYKKYMLGNI